MKVPVKPRKSKAPVSTAPRVLLLDIETKPIRAFVWDIWNINVGLNQIEEDWSILSYAAKWLDSDKMYYEDVSKQKDLTDDSKIMKGMFALLDEADIIITQNGKSFDEKRINSRFLKHDMGRPSSYKHIDTKRLAKKQVHMTSYGLEYMAKYLNCKHQKLTHAKFPGQALWTQCLKRNKEAWKEMEQYNKYDVLVLQDVYNKLAPWDDSINWNVYTDDNSIKCSCGSTNFRNKGYHYEKTGMFRRWKCMDCGKPVRGHENLLTKEKKKSMRQGPV